ncbi:HAD-IA family hydrolase [Pseudoalteromonas mariniglutinosa]|uniref:HAD-IA family hydrolase n=1 Tax=Pseudoalteromonas mariniglutinosa TaxID=206042 RepID=UPI00384C86D2
MKQFRLVIFDWDGTIMDSVPKIVNCLRGTAAMHNVPVPSSWQVKNVIGMSLAKAVAVLFPEHTELHPVLMSGYKQQYRELDNTETPLFTGVENTLKQLKANGILLAIATGKGRDGLERLMTSSQLKRYFNVTRCADDANSKPAPDMLEQILAYCHIKPEEAVMIGDSQLDMAMAEAAGVARIGVSFGAHSAAQLNTFAPLAVVDSYAELNAVLGLTELVE